MKKENFSQEWIFYKEDMPQDKEKVNLPHDAMIREIRGKDRITGPAGGYFPGGNYVYEKKFQVPADVKNETWILEVEGAYQEAFVFLNGNFVIANHNGYMGFYADLTSFLRYGMENTVEIKVKNDSQVNSRWYSGSGLYRPVWLWRGGTVRIAQNGLKISTPEVEREVSQVQLCSRLIYEGCKTEKVRMYTVLKDQQGKTVAAESTPVTLFKGENPEIVQRMYIRNADLWSPSDPNVYTCRVMVCLEENENKVFSIEEESYGELLDEAESTFGVRHIQIDPVKGLRINGKKMLLRGACIHHDHGIIGGAAFPDAEERRIRILKEAGFNAVRIAHHPASKALLEVCDRLGMLVLEESFDVWNHGKNGYDYARVFSDYWKQDIEKIVDKDFNHPCVFMYSIGNEIPELMSEDGISYSRKITERFRRLDGTRPVTNAVNGQLAVGDNVLPLLLDMGILTKEMITNLTGSADASQNQVAGAILAALASGDVNDMMTALVGSLGRVIEHPSVGHKMEEIMSHLDVCGYNYMMKRYEIDMKQYPNRVIYGSETNPPEIDMLWRYSEENAACIGDFTWSGWDYIGEAGVGYTRYDGKKEFYAPYPVYLAYCGDVDITGYRRPASYFREIVWGLRKEPYLSVQEPRYFGKPATCTPWSVPETIESWTFPGYEGMPVRVSVYAAGDEVALLCNEKEIGRKPVGRGHRYQASFETIYEPGELKAISYVDGKEVSRFCVVTAMPKLHLRTSLSRDILSKEGNDLCYLTIELVDENGVLYMDGEHKVTLQIDGSAVLQGFGSADPESKENFFDFVRTAYRGRLLAVLRGNSEGRAVVTISCEGCSDAVIELDVK